MQKLVIVSNRLPVTVERRRKELRFRFSTGGVATGLSSFYKRFDSTWIGWPGISAEKMSEREKKDCELRMKSDFQCLPVYIPHSDFDRYYGGFSNKTIWPLFHYFPQFVTHDEKYWTSYQRVNQRFCDVVCELAGKDDIIWIQDYHLMLLPALIRERLPHTTIGYFHHIPFPCFELFRNLPQRDALLTGLLGADIIGFHTDDYVLHFLHSTHRLLGYESEMGILTVDDRMVRVDAYPMGIDYELYAGASSEPGIQKNIEKVRRKVSSHTVVLSVDRLDYTKGIPRRLETFRRFLESYPEYHEKIIFVVIAAPSRTQVDDYGALKRTIDEMVGQINGAFGTINWIPIWYLYRSVPFESMVAFYNCADICFVTPFRDGMNLIAKEYIAARTDDCGVLILSEMAGAAKELGEAIIVNPSDRQALVSALKEAIEMSVEERVERNRFMRKRICRYNVIRWAEEFINGLQSMKKRQDARKADSLTADQEGVLYENYASARERLILLDYDGTLVPFATRPVDARPDDALLSLLHKLGVSPGNTVVILSGRDKDILEGWFGTLPVKIVAEHGVWFFHGSTWKLIEPLDSEWTDAIRPVLEMYVDRTPKSFIEEKEFSLAWHYRKVNSEFITTRVRELTTDLIGLTANMDLQVLEGNKVVEIRNSGINKGRAALQWITDRKWDFILAIGDDRTDEDMFRVLPAQAYSLKVGFESSSALYSISSYREVRHLLEKLYEGGFHQ